MDLMYQAGCRAVFIGFESTSTEDLAEVGKKHNIGINYKNIISSIHSHKIAVIASCILGLDNQRNGYHKQLIKDLNREPKNEEIAEKMEIPLEKVRKVLKIAREPISLETPIGEEEDSHLGDFIEDKKFVLPSDAAVNLNLAEQTRKVLATLTPREEKVLRMRFGIGERADHTLEEVGQDFTVTRERIRQIEAKALRKLRHPTRSRKLKSFIEN